MGRSFLYNIFHAPFFYVIKWSVPNPETKQWCFVLCVTTKIKDLIQPTQTNNPCEAFLKKDVQNQKSHNVLNLKITGKFWNSAFNQELTSGHRRILQRKTWPFLSRSLGKTWNRLLYIQNWRQLEKHSFLSSFGTAFQKIISLVVGRNPVLAMSRLLFSLSGVFG